MKSHESTPSETPSEFSPDSENFHVPNLGQNLGHTVTEILNSQPDQAPEKKSPAEIAASFQVDPENYQIFRQQTVLGFDGIFDSKKFPGRETEKYDQNLNETLGRYVRDTADLIATITGGNPELDHTKFDHVIYLDKSGRPAGWLVNTFWDDFADGASRPDQSYIAIDRKKWFEESGTDLLPGEHVRNQNGDVVLATFQDFNQDDIDPEFFAKLRALYLPDGLKGNETPEEIMHTPSSLDGKNILIVDEVRRSGSTLDIAQWLFKHAFPDARVEQTYFWNRASRDVKDSKGNTVDIIVGSIPIWYNNTDEGRGIGNVDPGFFQDRAEIFAQEYPEQDPGKVRAQAYGADFLGKIVDLNQETQHSSKELAREIVQMEKDYRAGRILMSFPKVYDEDKYIEHYEQLGVVFAPDSNKSPNTYNNIKKSYAIDPFASA